MKNRIIFNILMNDIDTETDNQFVKYDEQNHSKEQWLIILLEEVGEVARAILENKNTDYVTEMMKCSAVIFSALECYIKEV